MNIYEPILMKISKAHNEWVDAYSVVMPDLVEARKKSFTRRSLMLKSSLFRSLIAILNLLPQNKPPKYIFQGLRHSHLIEQLPAEEVMVLGGRNEWLYCFKKGYRFHWIAYVSHAFQMYIFGGKKNVLEWSIRRIHSIFSANNTDHRYLFLWEDSLPVGMTLSVVFSAFSKVKVVCVAHGMYVSLGRKIDSLITHEGSNCKFNLTWTDAQKNLLLCMKSKSTAMFVLGLPYDVKRSSVISREVVLIGHCGLSSDRVEYLLSLYRYRKIYMILQDAGWKVSFRPHPQDDINFAKKIFSVVCTEAKQNLFLKRKAFIGHASSLMFEAHQFGNIVFGLELQDAFGYDKVFDVDRNILDDEYSKLPFYLEAAFRKLESKCQSDAVESLSVRFKKCIKQIDAYVDEGFQDKVQLLRGV